MSRQHDEGPPVSPCGTLDFDLFSLVLRAGQSLLQHAQPERWLEATALDLKRSSGAGSVMAALFDPGFSTGLCVSVSRYDLTVTQRGEVETWLARGIRESVREALSTRTVRRGQSESGRELLVLPLVWEANIYGVVVLFCSDAAELPAPSEAPVQMLAHGLSWVVNLMHQFDRSRILTKALEAAANAVIITDRTGVIQWVNPAVTALTGYSPEELLGKTPRLMKSGLHDDAFYTNLWRTVSSGKVWSGEVQNRRKDGTVYIEEMTITPVRGPLGQVSHFIAVKQDVTSRREQESQILYLATHDPLTGLPNRRVLQDELGRILPEGWTSAGALLLLDLDNFKVINDTLGHAAGDELLRKVAGLFRSVLRSDSLVVRLGGDEFAVLLKETDLDGAKAVAERLRSAVSTFRFSFDGLTFAIGVSIGVAGVSAGLDSEGLLMLADEALYQAKDAGRNRVAVAKSAPERTISETGQWATRVKDALRDHRFRLDLQPVVDLRSDCISHFEALLRMVDADGSLQMPSSFMPAAERFGLMLEIDRWVVEKALDLLRRTPDPAYKLFINLSGSSLGDDDFLRGVESALASCPEAARRLGFEFTETILIADLSKVQSWIRRLAVMGCQFALDDFGTGFSTFSVLRNLDVSFVKIDGSFVRNVSRDSVSQAYITAIMHIAQATGKVVVAEQVESDADLATLQTLGVVYGQGFRLGVPGPPP